MIRHTKKHSDGASRMPAHSVGIRRDVDGGAGFQGTCGRNPESEWWGRVSTRT